MKIDKKKIVLGTAQFFSSYGIVNENKKQTKKHFYEILELAGKNDIFSYDTAPGYKSEKFLGDFILANQIHDAKVVTKIPKVVGNYKKFVENQINKSLKNLKTEINTLFFHNVSDLSYFIKDPQFFFNLRKRFPVNNIGFSVYEIKDLNKIKIYKEKLALQIPYNILNKSFSTVIRKNLYKPVFARSIFLQGILLKKILKAKNKSLKISACKYLDFLLKKKIIPIKYNLSFINSQKKINYFIFGIEKKKQLKEILNTEFKHYDKRHIKKINSFFDKKNIDPRNW